MTEVKIEELERLSKDLRAAAGEMGRDEVRFLVDSYYQVQDFRKASANQERALSTGGEPHDMVGFFAAQFDVLEAQLKRALDSFSSADAMGSWSREHVGIGPVIAAGLTAHIDITRAPTVGHIWRFAGLDPTTRWAKGERRPWNADLKVLCWKIGESFARFSTREDCFYGQVYRQRKAYELERDAKVREIRPPIKGWNDPVLIVVDGSDHWFVGGNAAAAAETLKTRNIRDKELLATYRSGHLPAGRLDQRARRYATKLFLAHWHGEAYRRHYGTEPPLPYAISHLGHAHEIKAPVPA